MSVPRGIAGFVGPNGAGKTTTINILLGLIKPDRGKATVFGLDSWDDSFEIRCKVGVLHEYSAYPKNFTGLRFLEHVAYLFGVSQPKEKAKEILSDVGLSKAADKEIKSYSAGMLRRLGLAQALIGDPELVILDEPTASIDPSGRIMVLERIKELHKSKGTCFLVATHVLPELEKICDWVSIIKEGKIVDQGSVRALATEYSADIYCAEVSHPDILAHELQERGFTEKVWVEETKVFCKVNNSEAFYEELPKIVARFSMQLRSLQFVRSTLEEIYKEVTGEKGR